VGRLSAWPRQCRSLKNVGEGDSTGAKRTCGDGEVGGGCRSGEVPRGETVAKQLDGLQEPLQGDASAKTGQAAALQRRMSGDGLVGQKPPPARGDIRGESTPPPFATLKRGLGCRSDDDAAGTGRVTGVVPPSDSFVLSTIKAGGAAVAGDETADVAARADVRPSFSRGIVGRIVGEAAMAGCGDTGRHATDTSARAAAPPEERICCPLPTVLPRRPWRSGAITTLTVSTCCHAGRSVCPPASNGARGESLVEDVVPPSTGAAEGDVRSETTESAWRLCKEATSLNKAAAVAGGMASMTAANGGPVVDGSIDTAVPIAASGRTGRCRRDPARVRSGSGGFWSEAAGSGAP